MATPAVTYTFAANTLIQASQANTNFQDIIGFLTNEVVQKDASVAFTVTPTGPAADPTGDNQFTRKAYVDDTLLGGFKLKAGAGSGTTDASGYLVYTHGLTFTPTAVLVTPKSPISGTTIFMAAICDSFGATTFRLRCFDNEGGTALASTAITFSWLALGPN